MGFPASSVIHFLFQEVLGVDLDFAFVSVCSK